jgi:hypothetical protein
VQSAKRQKKKFIRETMSVAFFVALLVSLRLMLFQGLMEVLESLRTL